MNAIGSTTTSGAFGWTTGTAFTFNMSYNAATQALRVTGNGLDLIVNIAATTLIRDLVIQTQAVTPGSIMTISDLVVDGVNLAGSRSQATQANLGQQIDNLWITGLRDSFQISGRIQMSWYSTAPTGTSNSASFRFGTANNTPVVFSSVVSEVPEPGTYAMFGIALLGLAAWRKRSSTKA